MGNQNLYCCSEVSDTSIPNPSSNHDSSNDGATGSIFSQMVQSELQKSEKLNKSC